jgi:hypothetical protein
MAYTAYKDSVELSKEGQAIVVVTITDGTNNYVKKYIVSPRITSEQLRLSILNDVENIVSADQLSKVLQVGEVDLTPPVITPSAKDVWFGNFATLKGMDEAIARGWVTADSKAHTDLKTLLFETFLPEYLSDLRMRVM